MTARKANARAKRKAFGYHEFPKGRGRLRCELCQLPLREHTMDTHPLVAKGGAG